MDDFIYLCDDAYNHSELLRMECDILCTMDYDLNAPVAYRFLRRYARVSLLTTHQQLYMIIMGIKIVLRAVYWHECGDSFICV